MGSLHEKGNKNTRERLFWENLGDNDLTKWRITRIEEGLKARCCCNQPVENFYVVRHAKSGVEKIIGKCCARRFGVSVSWASKADYLANARLMVDHIWEDDMIKRMQDKLPQWGSRLIISEKQKKQLERITGHRWRGKVWEE